MNHFSPFLFLLTFSITILFTGLAEAHKIRVFAWQEGDTVFVEARFSGARPAKNVSVSIEDAESHQQLLTGETDTDGNFSFILSKSYPAQLDVIVDGGDGHRGKWSHSVESETTVADTDTIEATGIQPPNIQATGDAGLQNISMEQLENVLEKVVDKKLGPIKKTLAETRDQGPSIQDILGGVGYIIGLAGIAAYFKSRQG